MATATVSIIPKGLIGAISVSVTLEEAYNDTLAVTEHPVEVNAAITDHSYRRPSEVVMRCGWSNADYAANANAPLAARFHRRLSMTDSAAKRNISCTKTLRDG